VEGVAQAVGDEAGGLEGVGGEPALEALGDGRLALRAAMEGEHGHQGASAVGIVAPAGGVAAEVVGGDREAEGDGEPAGEGPGEAALDEQGVEGRGPEEDEDEKGDDGVGAVRELRGGVVGDEGEQEEEGGGGAAGGSLSLCVGTGRER
jgi:hypothetical protein